MNNIKIEEFTQKIEEAIIKFQRTLPKQLSEEEIRAMEALIKEYVTYTLQGGCGMRTSLSNLLSMAIWDGNTGHVDETAYRPEQINSHIDRSTDIINSSHMLSNPEEGKLDENIPYLCLFISNSFLGIANHADQYLYSSDGSYETTSDFFVKSHAQTIREYEAKARKRDNTEKEPTE